MERFLRESNAILNTGDMYWSKERAGDWVKCYWYIQVSNAMNEIHSCTEDQHKDYAPFKQCFSSQNRQITQSEIHAYAEGLLTKLIACLTIWILQERTKL